MTWIHDLGFTYTQWIVIMLVACMVGLAKAGINGVVMLAVPMLASVVGGKSGTGLMLMLFIIGDIFAVLFYRRHADFKLIKQLVVWVVAGVLLGSAVGGLINDGQFQTLVGICVVICLILLVWMEIKGEAILIPQTKWMYILTGIACGFTSMIGNVAGPIFTIYLMAHRLKKNNFVGTVAVFFFMMNLIKLPLQVFFWHNYSLQTVSIGVMMIPIVLLGAFLGYRIIKVLNEKVFKYLIILMTAVAAIKLLL